MLTKSIGEGGKAQRMFNQSTYKAMKRFLVVMLLALPMLGASAQNVKQEKLDSFLVVMPQSFFERLSASYNLAVGLQNKQTTPLMTGVDFGFEVLPRLRVILEADYTVGLRSVDGNRTFDGAFTLGGGLSYRLFGGKGYTKPAQAKDALELQFTAGGSVGKMDWKQNYYDFRLLYTTRHRLSICTPFMGLGYRYVNSHAAGMKNYGGVYATIGMRF